MARPLPYPSREGNDEMMTGRWPPGVVLLLIITIALALILIVGPNRP